MIWNRAWEAEKQINVVFIELQSSKYFNVLFLLFCFIFHFAFLKIMIV